MSSFSYQEGQCKVDDGTRDLLTDTYRLYLLGTQHADKLETSLAAVLAAAPELVATGYSPKDINVSSITKSGSQCQRRLPNQTWSNVQSGKSIAAVLIGHVASDTPMVHLAIVNGPKVTNGGDVDLTLPNNTWVANVV